MTPQEPQQTGSVDFRQYIGILFLRWQTIAVCFLWCLLAGVVYLELAPKKYRTECRITLYVDPDLALTVERRPYWTDFRLHQYMLTNPLLVGRVVDSLRDEWGSRFSSAARMMLPKMGPFFVVNWPSRGL